MCKPFKAIFHLARAFPKPERLKQQKKQQKRSVLRENQLLEVAGRKGVKDHLGCCRAGNDRTGLRGGRGAGLPRYIVCDRLTMSIMDGVW